MNLLCVLVEMQNYGNLTLIIFKLKFVESRLFNRKVFSYILRHFAENIFIKIS